MTRAATLFAALLWIAQQRPGIFRIQPVRPVAELRAEVLQATPPSSRDWRHYGIQNQRFEDL